MKKLKINNYNDSDYKKYKHNSAIDYNLKATTDNNNYQWIDIFEKYIDYLDDIIRNPRRFIQSEELLVQIEKAKKVNEESVRHLAQHTNLIQSIEKDNMPKPSKILNVFKEETFDLYENRFIATLINKLYIFITIQNETIKNAKNTEGNSEKSVTYKSKTKVDNAEISASLKIDIKEKNDKIDLDAVQKRINALYQIINQFKKSPLMKSLERAQPVRSPIRKTNAILKDYQLRKCLELWEFLEQLQSDIELDEYVANTFIDENEFIENITLSNYINFCALTNRLITGKEEIDDKARNIFSDLIKLYIERPNIGLKNFRKELIDDLDMLCQQYENDYNKIKNSYDKFFSSFNYFE